MCFVVMDWRIGVSSVLDHGCMVVTLMPKSAID